MSTRSARLSDSHRNIHRTWLILAKRARDDGAKHAYFMEAAARARFYFRQLRELGE